MSQLARPNVEQSAVAKRPENKPQQLARPTVKVDAQAAADQVTAKAKPAANLSMVDVAASRVEHQKAAAMTAYAKGMGRAIPEVLEFMGDVDQAVGAELLAGMETAYRPYIDQSLIGGVQ